MSIGRPNPDIIIGEDLYRANQARIEEARAYVDAWSAMNEEGKKKYDLIESELAKKIREGEEAKRMLQAMKEVTLKQAPVTSPVTNGDATQQHNTPLTTPRVEQNNGHILNQYSTQQRPQWVSYAESSASQAGRSSQHSQITTPQIATTPKDLREGRYYPSQQQAQQALTGSLSPGYLQSQQIPSSQWRQGKQTQPPPAAAGQVQRSSPLSQPMPQQLSVTHGRQKLPMQQVIQTGHSSHTSGLRWTTPLYPPNQRHQQTAFSGQQQQPQIQAGRRDEPHMQQTAMAQQMAHPSAQPQVPIMNTAGNTSYLPAFYKRPALGSSSLAGALDMNNQKNHAKAPMQATVEQNNESTGVAVISQPPSSTAPSALTSSSSPLLSSATDSISQPQPNTRVGPRHFPISEPSVHGNTPSSPQASGNSAAGTPVSRLKNTIARWERTAPPNSFFDVPTTAFKVYKDKNSIVHFVTPDNKGGYTYVSMSSLDDNLSLAVKKQHKYYRTDAGSSQYTTTPLTTGQAGKYHPYSHYTAASDGRASSSWPVGPSNQFTTSTVPTSGNLPRTPSQADKAHLARDILRALGYPSTQKRPLPEEGSEAAPTVEPLAKRRALESETEAMIAANFTEANNDSLPVLETNGTLPTSRQPAPTPDDQSALPLAQYSAFPSAPAIPSTVKPHLPHPPTSAEPSARSSFGTPTLLRAPESVTEPIEQDTQTTHALSSSSRLPTPPHAIQSPIVDFQSQTIQQKTPLFLPSPSSSPSIAETSINRPEQRPAELIATESEECPMEMGDGTNETVNYPKARINGTKKYQSFYILVPSRPDYVQKHKTRKLEKMGRRKAVLSSGERFHLGTGRGSSSGETRDEEFNYTDPTSNNFVDDDAEREAIRLSCSRLSRRPCKWNGCGAVMNSAENLIKHFSIEHTQHSKTRNNLTCMWQRCGQRFSHPTKLFRHFKNHAQIPLLCGYDDCEETFRIPRQLLRHHRTDHKNDFIKPSTKLINPKLGRLPDCPAVLPSYMVEARPVRPAPISEDRHASLSPRVSRQVAGPVNVGTKRYNAAKPLLRSRSRDATDSLLLTGDHQYDFLTFSSANFSTNPSQPSRIRDLGDLDSGDISELVYDGMTLWDVEEEEALQSDSSASPWTPAEQDALGWEEEEVLRSELSGSQEMKEGVSSDQPETHDEEEVVESMLTVPLATV